MNGDEIRHLVLPIPPSDNARLMIRANQRRIILTPRAREFLIEARLITRVNWPKGLILVPSQSYQLHITAKAYVPNWRGDCSNYTKLLKDALTQIVYDDDKFVHINYEDTEKDEKNPRIELTIPINRISLGTIVQDTAVEKERPNGCTCAYPSLIALGWPRNGIVHHPKCEFLQPDKRKRNV